MPGPGTSLLGGPLITGTVPVGAVDMGIAVLSQTTTMVSNTTNAVSFTFNLPINAKIVDVLVDTTTAWNSATSDTFTLGTTAGATTYAGSVDVKTSAGRVRPTFTGAQLLAMANITTNTTAVATITPVGSATAGNTVVTLIYVQNLN